MAICKTCGKAYDELAYQVTIPLLGGSFDRFECAEAALQKYLRAKRALTEDAPRPMNAADAFAEEPTD